jgi:hypothetical protein
MPAQRTMRAIHAMLLALPALTAGHAHAAIDPEILSPVPVVQDGRLDVKTELGAGSLPIHTSRDWTLPQPDVTRAIVVIHGWPRRDLRSGEYAAAHAGSAAQDAIIVTPQFLIPADIAAHHLPDTVLRWGINAWAAGDDAEGPAPISSFDALDAILARLADRLVFPNLRTVVIAGHSAGGRFVQHYAAISHGQAPLLNTGIHIRYVVANPSVYLYFTSARPVAPPTPCPGVNRWQYGLGSGLPRYALRPVEPDALRAAYLARDITYLLGTADTDPTESQLDRTCAGEAQGATRFERGIAYLKQLRPPGAQAPGQTLFLVPGIGHHSSQMFASACGLFALFDQGQCANAAAPDTAVPTEPH